MITDHQSGFGVRGLRFEVRPSAFGFRPSRFGARRLTCSGQRLWLFIADLVANQQKIGDNVANDHVANKVIGMLGKIVRLSE